MRVLFSAILFLLCRSGNVRPGAADPDLSSVQPPRKVICLMVSMLRNRMGGGDGKGSILRPALLSAEGRDELASWL
ncbi:hypothetical protein RADP37_05543 [Roseomonas mucosa]|uniref:Uncharacterized protein n=1 Tax=Roseomonas mucosa TaxID=207340 RepID=A0A4Y1MS64_9PROT|nr:hypothetical protein RADP37_05543 [Roseomonas mucosa]